MDLSIKAMAASDYSDALELWKESEGIGLNESDAEAAIAQYLARNPGFSLVARDAQGKMLGAVLCGHDGRRGFLYHLAVAKSHRLNGIGRKLVDQCMSELKKVGIPRCFIFIYADNEEGKAFWKRHDWEERHQMRIMQYYLADVPRT
jgi:putative acetyltransferase